MQRAPPASRTPPRWGCDSALIPSSRGEDSPALMVFGYRTHMHKHTHQHTNSRETGWRGSVGGAGAHGPWGHVCSQGHGSGRDVDSKRQQGKVCGRNREGWWQEDVEPSERKRSWELVVRKGTARGVMTGERQPKESVRQRMLEEVGR